MEAILRRHWPEWNGTLQKRTGGWNNTTYFVKSGGRSGVLRVYDTHRDLDKIEFEHAVLQELSKHSLSLVYPSLFRRSWERRLLNWRRGAVNMSVCSNT